MSLVDKFIPGNEVNNGLYKAIFSGDLEKITHIIDLFGFSYCRSWDGGHDLLLTAVECKHIDVAKLLIYKGCKLEDTQSETSEAPRSLIHLAVKYGDPELISLLIDRDKSSLTKTLNGDSILHTAVIEGRQDVVELLVKYGADTECRTNGGKTPLHLACIKGNVEMVKQLMKAGADLESKDNNGKTGLFLAVSSGHKTVAKTLLEKGANCKCKSKNGQTPLLDATGKCHLDIVTDLLHFGADFNDRNIYGQTPLHMACMLKNKDLIAILLNAGADVNATDSTGMVPFDAVARKLSHREIYFESSSLSYLMGKHFVMLKIGGFYLNKKNQTFHDLFYNMYINEIALGNVILSPASNYLLSTIKYCEDQICLMKNIKSDHGFTVYDVFRKLKDPLSVITESEIKLLESTDIHENFYSYEGVIKSRLKYAKVRRELVAAAEPWFSFLLSLTQNKLPVLPEEVRIYVISYLTNDELQQIVKIGEEMCNENMYMQKER